MKFKLLPSWKSVGASLLLTVLGAGISDLEVWAHSGDEVFRAQIITAATGQVRGRVQILQNGNMQVKIGLVTPGGSYQVWRHDTLTDTDTQIAVITDLNGDGFILGVEGRFKPFVRGTSFSSAFLFIPSTAGLTPPFVSLDDSSFVSGFAIPLFPSSSKPLFVSDILNVVNGAPGVEKGRVRVRSNGIGKIEIEDVTPGSSYQVCRHNTVPDTDAAVAVITDFDQDGEIDGPEGTLPSSSFPPGTSASLTFILLPSGPSGTSCPTPPLSLGSDSFVSGFSLRKDHDEDEDDDD